ncbi:unnamed protein product [Phytophthora lilii]|uniref:Unnamed protein product n=1 Tax=Phytophthora lilii TaxID=2077276 RepID=A0A9W6UD95_9STRA|nr:unnamed protein product [Phytophthora lilii]
MDRSEFPHLTDSQFESVRKMGGISGMDVLRSLAAATLAEQIERVAVFDMYERGLIDHVRGTLQVPRTEPKVVQPKPLKLKVHPYDGKEGENLHFWIREVELAMDAALISDERLRVAFALSHLSGRAKTWATHGACLSSIGTTEHSSSQAPGSERSLAEAAITGPGECRTPVGAGRPTGEDLSLHERCAGGAHHGDLAPESLCTLETEKGSGGLLVVHASVRGYSNPFRVLIDSGASKNFARRQTVARKWRQVCRYSRENEGYGLVSVRLADGTVVEVPRVHMDLAVKFEDFDSAEQLIVLKMDNHVPTSARYQGVLRDRLNATASEVVAGVVEEKSDPDAEVAVRDATGRRTRSTTDWAPCPACEPVMPTGLDAESRRALRVSTVSALSSADEVGNIGPPAGNRVPRAAGAAGVGNQVPHERVAQTITDREDVASASCAGNQVPHYKVGNMVPRVVQTITDEEVAESASCVGNLVPHDAGNIVSHEAEISEESIEDASCVGNVVPRMVKMTEESEVVIDTSGMANPAPHDASEARNAPLREASHVNNMEPRDGRRQRPCQVSGLVTNPATVTEGDTEPGAPTAQAVKECYHIFDGETGRRVKADAVHLAALPEISELLNLEEMSMVDFLAELKASEIAEIVLLRPEHSPEEINSSSVMDEAVLEELKKRREARLGSEVLKNPKDPVYPLLTAFADVVSKDPLSQLPPNRGIRHEIDPCLAQSTVSPDKQCEVIDAFFAAKAKAGMVRESKSPHSMPTFCVRKPYGKWRLVHAYNKLISATVPAQTPIPRKDVLLNNMAG